MLIFIFSEDKSSSCSDDGNVVVKKNRKQKHSNPLKQSVSNLVNVRVIHDQIVGFRVHSRPCKHGSHAFLKYLACF